MAVPLATVVAPLQARYGGLLASFAPVPQAAAQRVARRAPFVHRLGKDGGPPWRQVFGGRELSASAPCTDCERAAGGMRVVYFFLASGAYARGSIALIADNAFALSAPSTATAFDSGACADHAQKWLDRSGAAFASESERCTFIAANKLANAHIDLYEFVESFLVAHFDEPVDYVRREQHSVPDRPVYHDLASPSQDRRAWTIELQRHASLPLPSDSECILRIVLADRDLFMAIPSEYRRFAAIAAPRSMEEAIAEFCESHVGMNHEY